MNKRQKRFLNKLMNEIGPLEPCCRDCLLPLKTTITSSRKESERVKN